jgi:hypothetical protein
MMGVLLAAPVVLLCCAIDVAIFGGVVSDLSRGDYAGAIISALFGLCFAALAVIAYILAAEPG